MWRMFPGCVDSFTKNSNKNAAGAAQDTTATTQEQCEDVCLAKSFSSCGAYEFNTQKNQCWIHGSRPASLNDASGIDHYTRTQCPQPGLFVCLRSANHVCRYCLSLNQFKPMLSAEVGHLSFNKSCPLDVLTWQERCSNASCNVTMSRIWLFHSKEAICLDSEYDVELSGRTESKLHKIWLLLLQDAQIHLTKMRTKMPWGPERKTLPTLNTNVSRLVCTSRMLNVLHLNSIRSPTNVGSILPCHPPWVTSPASHIIQESNVRTVVRYFFLLLFILGRENEHLAETFFFLVSVSEQKINLLKMIDRLHRHLHWEPEPECWWCHCWSKCIHRTWVQSCMSQQTLLSVCSIWIQWSGGWVLDPQNKARKPESSNWHCPFYKSPVWQWR